MIEIRIHGRGGQGAVIASEVLASALFKEGKFVQAFPAFGAERRGAPVAAFARVDDRPIRIRREYPSAGNRAGALATLSKSPRRAPIPDRPISMARQVSPVRSLPGAHRPHLNVLRI